ncbi:hypothetical protein PV328_001451 [Microctonus aethiopoides]|uniref:Putative alpha-L-fucosidase n=1 Tax=Microctonus aethiopoides TaxID=144406 RepID=A0AA39FX87_9HYME|nr:hypothetical protein PV328_001451 [Microctonus aethiopoides]
MYNIIILLSFIFLLSFVIQCQSRQDLYIVENNLANDKINGSYVPTWESLDKRPLPTWYDDAKIGIFIHWGVFSVPSFGSEWFWKQWTDENGKGKFSEFMKQRYPEKFTYQEFAHEFTAEFFNATQWSDLIEASGAKYVVLTSKHHEGYTLWPSKYSFSWNSMDIGPHRDLIGELAKAIKSKSDVKFGLYHSLFEWYNPLWILNKQANFTSNEFVSTKIYPEMLELINKYEPEVFWSDGEWEAPDTYWKSKEFLTWLFNDSPVKNTVVVNDRWGHDTLCHHGDFYTCQDRYNPGVLQKHKWENAMTIDRKSWGYRRNAALNDYMSIDELVKELAITVSCGGNLLMNIGPTKDGIIAPIFEERLRQMGKWLDVNGEAIYKTRPWKYQNDTISGDTWFTMNEQNKILYAIILSWPQDNILRLGVIELATSDKLSLLGYENTLKWSYTKKTLEIMLPLTAHKGQPAWVIKIVSKSLIK